MKHYYFNSPVVYGLFGCQNTKNIFFPIYTEVPCNDKSYQWMLEWITKRGATKTQHLSVRTTFDESLGRIENQIEEKKKF